MAIKGNPVGNPITRDRIHLLSLSINQDAGTLKPKRLTMITKLYGMDGDVKVFDNSEIKTNIKDFESLMIEMLIASGVAPQDIPAAVNQARIDATTMNIVDCFAAFEHGIGLVLKHLNQFDYTETI